MRILITNDDGIDTLGIRLLAEWAKKYGEVTVVAPKVEQSGKSQAIEFVQPVEIKKVPLIDGVTAGLCRLLPKTCANREKKIFQVSAKEKAFYEKLNIRKWKDKVPEIGQFTGFRKNKIADPKSVEYLDRYLLEICYGEIGHIASVFTSFFILGLFFISPLWLGIAMPVAGISALLNLPSLFILRYNSYKLEILRKNLLKRQKKENA